MSGQTLISIWHPSIFVSHTTLLLYTQEYRPEKVGGNIQLWGGVYVGNINCNYFFVGGKVKTIFFIRFLMTGNTGEHVTKLFVLKDGLTWKNLTYDSYIVLMAYIFHMHVNMGVSNSVGTFTLQLPVPKLPVSWCHFLGISFNLLFISKVKNVSREDKP